MPGPPLPGGPVLVGNGKKPLRPSLRSATSPVRGGFSRAEPAKKLLALRGDSPLRGEMSRSDRGGSGPKDWPSLRGLRGFATFPQTPLSLTFFEKKVSKEAFNISTKKHLLAGHTHTGQQVLLFTL